MIRKSEFVTGIFILAAIAVLGYVAMKPAQEKFGGGAKVAWVAEFDNVALLKVQAKVAASGIQVGNVEEQKLISRDGKLFVRVSMLVDEEFAKTCYAGTQARIKQEGLLGDRFVDVVPVITDTGPLPQDDGVTVISAQPYSDWTTMLDEMKGEDGVLGKAGSLIDNLNSNFLSQENSERLANLLDSSVRAVNEAEGLLQRLREEMDKDDGLLANANRAASGAADLLENLNRDYPSIKQDVDLTFDKVQDLLDNGSAKLDQIGDILGRADPKLMSLLDTTNDRLPKLFDELDVTLKDAQTLLRDTDEVVRNKDIAGLLYDARVTLQELTLTIQAIRADPSQVIFGGPGVAQPAVPDPKNDLKNIQSGKPKRYGY